MSNFVLLGFCILAGIVLRASRRLPKETPSVLNGFVSHISLPALILVQFPRVNLNADSLYPVLSAWIIFVFSWISFTCLGRWLRWDTKTTGTLILTGGLGNTSFVGFPLLEALYGRDSLQVGMLVDQVGTFLVLSTLALGVASFYTTKSLSFRPIARRILSFPPIYALGIACICRFYPLPLPLNEMLMKLSATVTPLALVSVGYQLTFEWESFRTQVRPLFGGLLFKLFLAPAALFFLYVILFRARGEAIQITLIETAMAPMITAAVVASEYGLNSRLASLMIGVGIPLSLCSVPIWAYLLRGI